MDSLEPCQDNQCARRDRIADHRALQPATTRRVSWLTRIVPIGDEQSGIYTVRYEAVNAMFDHVACFIINANHSIM
jgi:hypothetical protein